MNSSTAGTSERTLRSMLAILFVQFGPSVIFRAEADSDYASKSREGQNKCNIREIIMTVAIKDQKWDCREMPLGPSGFLFWMLRWLRRLGRSGDVSSRRIDRQRVAACFSVVRNLMVQSTT